jgi:hypothetical protein
MYDTSGSHSVCYAATPDNNLDRRLSWLRAEIARDELRDKTFRIARKQRSLPALGVALSTEEAYAWFGTFLGLFPPFAIFCRVLTNGFRGDAALGWGLIFLSMNAVCCLVGRKSGAYFGRKMGDPHAWSWLVLFFCSMLMGTAWAIITGAAGGAVGFGFGAIFGVICAVPVALAGFPVFATLHRAVSRDGMIEERRLWPLVFGIPIIIAALILSPGIYQY